MGDGDKARLRSVIRRRLSGGVVPLSPSAAGGSLTVCVLTVYALRQFCYHDAMIRTQVQLTEEQFRMLKEVSASTGRSMAELIREAVDRLGAVAGVDRRARAIAAIGGFRSGSNQVSGSHDDELTEAFAE